MKKKFQKTYLEVGNAKNKLESDGGLSEKWFWVEGGLKNAVRGK